MYEHVCGSHSWYFLGRPLGLDFESAASCCREEIGATKNAAVSTCRAAWQRCQRVLRRDAAAERAEIPLANVWDRVNCALSACVYDGQGGAGQGGGGRRAGGATVCVGKSSPHCNSWQVWGNKLTRASKETAGGSVMLTTCTPSVGGSWVALDIQATAVTSVWGPAKLICLSEPPRMSAGGLLNGAEGVTTAFMGSHERKSVTWHGGG